MAPIPVWSFQLNQAIESLLVYPGGRSRSSRSLRTARAVLVRPEAWGGSASPWAFAHVARRMRRTYGAGWRTLGREQLDIVPPGDTAAFVVADPRDADAFRTAERICARHAAGGAMAMLFAAGGRAGFPRPANVLPLHAHCVIASDTADPVRDLVREAEHFCSTGGLLEQDPADLRAALATGGQGWSVRARAEGEDRVGKASADAIAALRGLGARPDHCGAALVSVSSPSRFRLEDVEEVGRRFGDFLAPADGCRVLIDHRFSAAAGLALELRALLVARLTP
jgi:hypothetical protein